MRTAAYRTIVHPPGAVAPGCIPLSESGIRAVLRQLSRSAARLPLEPTPPTLSTRQTRRPPAVASIGGVRISRRARLAIVLLCATVVFIGALWPVYVRPHTDAPVRADAILVLGGAHDGREELGLRLAHEGFAPRVLISDPYEDSELVNRICHGGYSFEVECFDPAPRTTRGEGRYLAERARAEGWRKVMVVTFTPHISRARDILEKCWDGELLMLDARPPIGPLRWAFQYAYQTAGYLKVLVEDC